MASKLESTGAEMEFDAARNQWWTLPGRSEQALIIGGHLDSVPNGGWLDGALNVVAGSEVFRRLAQEEDRPVTVRLVSWADEEGARFGRSLFGSSAAAGSMADQEELRTLVDGDGVSLPEAIGVHGVDLDRAIEARKQLENAAAYLELHIEQGPVLESLDMPLGAVLGTFGVERHRVVWRGQAAHAGSTPMDQRRDALAGAAKLALALRDIAARVGDGAVCTSGGVVCKPGIVTSVVETAEQLLDQRHLDASKLAAMLADAKALSEQFAREEDVEVGVRADLEHRADPVRRAADRARGRGRSARWRGNRSGCRAGRCTTRPRWLAAGIPTVMLFVQSLRGLSHTKLEDTKEEHLELSVRALDQLTAKTIESLAASARMSSAGCSCSGAQLLSRTGSPSRSRLRTANTTAAARSSTSRRPRRDRRALNANPPASSGFGTPGTRRPERERDDVRGRAAGEDATGERDRDGAGEDDRGCPQAGDGADGHDVAQRALVPAGSAGSATPSPCVRVEAATRGGEPEHVPFEPCRNATQGRRGPSGSRRTRASRTSPSHAASRRDAPRVPTAPRRCRRPCPRAAVRCRRPRASRKAHERHACGERGPLRPSPSQMASCALIPNWIGSIAPAASAKSR